MLQKEGFRSQNEGVYICKREVRDMDIIPVYGRGNVYTEAEALSEAEVKCSLDHGNLKILKIPHTHSVESSRIERFRRSQVRSIPAWLDVNCMVRFFSHNAGATMAEDELRDCSTWGPSRNPQR